MPNQPGSAPSKRVSAKEVLADYEFTNDGSGSDAVVIRALRVFVRVEAQRDGSGPTIEAMSTEVQGHIEDAHTGPARNYCVLNDAASFLSDLAALVAPTDADNRKENT